MTDSSQPHAPDVGAHLDAAHVMPCADGLALRASRCTACGQATFPSSTVCPFCLEEMLEDLPLAGSARLYAFTRVHVAPRSWTVPYAVGYADFPNGLRLLAKLADAGDGWAPDQRVRLQVVPAGESRYRYYFAGEHA